MAAIVIGAWLGAAPRAHGDEQTPKPTAAQTPTAGQEEQVLSAEQVVDPKTVVPGTMQQVPTTEPQPQPEADDEKVVVAGNAAFQSTEAKRREARLDCQRTQVATSQMLGIQGRVASDENPEWWPLLIVVGGSLLLFVVAAILKGWLAPGLQGFTALVGLVISGVGVAVALFPGLTVNERPAQEATMKVREVHPRITRNEYALQTRTPRKGVSKTDLREIGNVVWLEIRLRGYAGKHISLQYGLYKFNGEVLLPNTAKEVPLAVEDADEQASFVPVWVGYPTAASFQAQFRLLEHGRVRELARTGKMSGSTVRYRCPRTHRAQDAQ